MACHVCGTALSSTARRDAKFCSKRCNLAGQPPCSVEECDKPKRAKGLCHQHYKQQGGGRYRAYARTCIVCDLTWQTTRSDGKYCSDLCKGLDYAGVSVRLCVIPATHPVCSTPVPSDHPSRDFSLPMRDCDWCGTTFKPMRWTNKYCRPRCKAKAATVRRAGRAADGHVYSWTQVMRVFALLDGCCAYCEQPVDGPPDPDHVVPLSRHGSNGNANILPACRLCNSDKRDLLLHEWAEDRASRGKSPVRTVLDRNHPAFAHLLPDAIASGWPRPVLAHAA